MGNQQASVLWGANGELYNPAGPLDDWSMAGYAGRLASCDSACPVGAWCCWAAADDRLSAVAAAGSMPLPTYPAKFNVRDYGARADGRTGGRLGQLHGHVGAGGGVDGGQLGAAACAAADDSAAFQAAINAASAAAAKSNSGVAVLVPDGTYAIKKTISISQSNVVLRGASVGAGLPTSPRCLAACRAAEAGGGCCG